MDDVITRLDDAAQNGVTAAQLTPSESAPRVGTWLLSWTAVLAGVLAVGLSAYMFYRFAENDTGVIVLLSAFILCFGGGALAYGPLFIMARLMRRAWIYPQKSQALWVLALAGPWVIAGGIMLTFSNILRYAGIVAIGLSLVFCVWALRHIWRYGRKQR